MRKMTYTCGVSFTDKATTLAGHISFSSRVFRKGTLCIFHYILFAVISVYAADFSGVVIDGQSGDPVEGVLVSIGYSQDYTRTDSQGNFSLSSGSSAVVRKTGSIIYSTVRWNFAHGILDLSDAHEIVSVGLFSLNGRCMHTGPVPHSRKVAFPSLARGVYILELTGAGGARFSSRVIFSGKAESQSLKIASFADVPKVSASAEEQAGRKLIFRHDDFYPLDLSVSGSASGMRINLEPDERSLVFDKKKVRTYRFTISSEDSLYLETYGHRESYVPAQMQFEDEQIGTVGLRYKGSDYSMQNCFDTANHVRLIEKEVCRKISFKVKFDKYDSDKRLYRMKRLNLHSMSADPTKMHDMVSYELYRDMGIFSPRSSYANVVVNNTNLGLFVAVEDIDGRFTDSRWPAYGDGNLYKEAWPTDRPKTEFRRALATNDNPEDNPDVSGMMDFSEAISSSTAETFIQDLSPFVDFNYLLRYIAVDRAIKNWDGIMGWYTDENGNWAGNHNFYFYEEENVGGQFWLIPWDLDNTLFLTDPYMESAGIPNWNEAVTNPEPMPVWNNTSYIYPPCYDKFTRLLAEVLWDDFVDIGEDFLEKLFQSQRLIEKVDTYFRLVSDIIAEDPIVSEEDWQAAVNDLKESLPFLQSDFSDHLRNIKPEVDSSGYLDPFPYDSHLRTDALNNFEFSPVDISEWSHTYSSENSTTSLVHDTLNPLYGTADVRFSFELVSLGSSEGWSEWSGFGLLFPESADLSNLKQIQLSIRSDFQRNVRISIQSDVYEDMGALQEYGWSIEAGTETKTVILPISRMSYPSWGDPDNPDIKQTVLEQASAIAFSPGGRFDNVGELLVDPDSGHLRVDNIRFVFE